MRCALAHVFRFAARRFKSLALLGLFALAYQRFVSYVVFGGGVHDGDDDSWSQDVPVNSVVWSPLRDKATTRLDLGGGRGWTVRNENGSVLAAATVPGGIYTDLSRAGFLGDKDIYYRFHHADLQWVGLENWIYENTFFVPADLQNTEKVMLNFEGLDTVADIILNGHNVGSSDNMFVRYRFDVKNWLRYGETNHLVVAFQSPVNYARKRFGHHSESQHYRVPPVISPPSDDDTRTTTHINFIRKMQSSFGWAGAPALPSCGIWRPLFLEAYDGASIQYIRFLPHKTTNDRWKFVADVFLERSTRHRDPILIGLQLFTTQGNMIFERDKEEVMPTAVAAGDGNDGLWSVSLEVLLPPHSVSEWWPNGLGEQPLYRLLVSVSRREDDSVLLSQKSVTVGFRSVLLVEQPIKEDTGGSSSMAGFSFFFKVNEFPLFVRGSSLASPHLLPERWTKGDVDSLLKFAQKANFNMLRVRAEGVYETDYLYTKAAELGILVWQDFAFTSTLYPATKTFLQSVEQECLHQVRRLQHHPSLALFNSNNGVEMELANLKAKAAEAATAEEDGKEKDHVDDYVKDYARLFFSTVGTVCASEAPDTPWLSSSPSNGRYSWQQADLAVIAEDPNSEAFGVTRVTVGDGTEEDDDNLEDTWLSFFYPVPRFIADYGFPSLPTLSTLRRYADGKDLDWQSDFLSERSGGAKRKAALARSNDFQLGVTVTSKNASFNGETSLARMLYLAQVNQAESVKAATEHFRRCLAFTTDKGLGMTMGVIYGQLNSPWPGASLSALEYGGKRKLASFQLERSFQPVMVSVDEISPGTLAIFVTNDGRKSLKNLVIAVKVQTYSGMEPCSEDSFNEVSAPASTTTTFITLPVEKVLDKCKVRESDDVEEKLTASGFDDFRRLTTFLHLDLKKEGGEVISSTYQLLCKPQHAVGLSDPLLRASLTSEDSSGQTFLLRLQANSVALFVQLDSDLEGVFSDNGFMMVKPRKKITFRTSRPRSLGEVKRSITVMSYFN